MLDSTNTASSDFTCRWGYTMYFWATASHWTRVVQLLDRHMDGVMLLKGLQQREPQNKSHSGLTMHYHDTSGAEVN